MTIVTVPTSSVLPLRHAVLRAGLPPETAVFPGDDAPTTRHVAAVNDTGDVIGCLTLHLNSWNGTPAYQLRGMATAPDYRGKGLGRALLTSAEDFVRTTPIRTIWCNARTPAAGFYTAMGWHIVSEPFDIPTAGPHVKMLRELTAGP